MPVHPVEHLVLDPAHAARDDRPRLPHRLGDGQPEALGQRLLHDDVGAGLERVDDRAVLLGVLHRQAGEVDPRPRRVRERAPGGDDLLRAPRRPRGRRRRRRSPGRRARGARRSSSPTWRAKPWSTPTGSLRRSQRETWATTRASGGSGASSYIAAWRSTRPGVPSSRRNTASVGSAVGDQPRGAEDARHRRGRQRLVLGREGVDRGRDDQRPLAVEPVPDEALAREDVHVGRRRRTGAGSPTSRARCRSGRRRRRGAPDHADAGGAQRAAPCPAVCGSWRITTSPGSSISREPARRAPGDGLVQGAVALVRAPPRPRAPCRQLWMRLVSVEELRRPLEHEPARVDAGAARVGEQRAQHLGDAAAVGGRVHAPDDPAGQQLAARGRRAP